MTKGFGIGGNDPGKPLTVLALKALRQFSEEDATVGLAVSGGSDSMAMLHLMAEVAVQARVRLQVATVDHRLRPEAATEAEEVGRVCAGLGLPHDVLVWDHGPIAGNLMQAAADARYGLLAHWAKQSGAATVMLAHTADDQAETFLMGLSRASGLDGLSGMRRRFDRDGISFCRPFLAVSRQDLRQWLSQRGLGWMDDPSNDNPRFSRVRARRVTQALAPLGITVQQLSAVTQHLSMAQGVVRAATARAAQEAVTEFAGSLSFDLAGFLENGPEIARRLLIGMVRWMNGEPHPPREAKIAALLDAVGARRDATLGGVRFQWKADRCFVMREARALGGPVNQGQVWDNRWTVSGAGQGHVRAVGADGLAQIPDWRAAGFPRGVALSTPAIWREDRLISAPLLGFGVPCDATMTPSFVSFLLSH